MVGRTTSGCGDGPGKRVVEVVDFGQGDHVGILECSDRTGVDSDRSTHLSLSRRWDRFQFSVTFV